MKHANKNKKLLPGYTLVELLTVIAILSAIGTIVISVVFITLTGAKKTDNVETLRQNGDNALSQMVKAIRYAKSLDAPASCVPSTTTNAITFTSLADNQQTTYACTGTSIASNSASFINTNVVKTSSCSFVCTQSTLTSPPDITIQFTLVPVTASNLAENKATINFQSSVTLRNYSR